MKNLLYFEYKKNRTTPTILLIIVILFAVTNLVVFLASQQSLLKDLNVLNRTAARLDKRSTHLLVTKSVCKR